MAGRTASAFLGFGHRAGLSLLLFPDGRLPSRRCRPMLWAYLALGALWLGGAFAIS